MLSNKLAQIQMYEWEDQLKIEMRVTPRDEFDDVWVQPSQLLQDGQLATLLYRTLRRLAVFGHDYDCHNGSTPERSFSDALYTSPNDPPPTCSMIV